jgi:hypothetical protein
VAFWNVCPSVVVTVAAAFACFSWNTVTGVPVEFTATIFQPSVPRNVPTALFT